MYVGNHPKKPSAIAPCLVVGTSTSSVSEPCMAAVMSGLCLCDPGHVVVRAVYMMVL